MLSITDPLGRHIVLTRKNWEAHIVNRHPDVDPDWIAETLEEPDFIAQDATLRRTRRQRLCYYRRGILPRLYGDSYMKVVVELRSSRRSCLVITAFPAERMKREEQVIWSRPNT